MTQREGIVETGDYSPRSIIGHCLWCWRLWYETARLLGGGVGFVAHGVILTMSNIAPKVSYGRVVDRCDPSPGPKWG